MPYTDGTPYRYGWLQKREDHQSLMATQERFDLSHYMKYRIPREIDQRPRITIKDQNGMGACSGFSRATLEELLNGILTRWKTRVTLSAMFAYLTNQQCCGCFGKDDGATIDGSAKAAKKFGICREELFPFPGRYSTDIPDEAMQEGKEHVVESHSVISSYEDAIQYLGTVGVIQIGMPVGTEFEENCKGILDETMVRRDAKRPKGGHALAIGGYLLPETIGGDGTDPYLLGVNSWANGWGDNGFFYISPDAFRYLLSLMNHGEVECIGMSHLRTFDGKNNDPLHDDVIC